MRTGSRIRDPGFGIQDSGAGAARLLLAAGLAALVLAGCGGAPKRADEPEPAPRAAEGKARKPGGYYLDDGPGENPPADLAAIPDALPRPEALHRFANRPYTVMGQTYVPATELRPYREQGLASWYGKRYHGQKTSSGERYDMYAMSAAHTTLPIPSYVRVTHLGNGRSVVVRINDRGPFHSDRLIDLSYAAAWKLGIVGPGSAMVEVESVDPAAPVVSAAPASPVRRSAPAPVTSDAAGGVFVQLAAFGIRENAESFSARVRAYQATLGAPLGIVDGGGVFRVQAGPYPSRDAADLAAERIREALGLNPVLRAP